MHYVSIDVEAVATGRGHSDRAPCRVSVVGAEGELLLDEVIHVEAENIYDPLTEVTGLGKGEIAEGVPFGEVRERVLGHLTADTVVVGQSPSFDIKYMELREGVDFGSVVDTAVVFRSYNPRFDRYIHHSLRNIVYGLLGEEIQCGVHSSVIDAQKTMEVYQKFGREPGMAEDAAAKLYEMFISRGFPENNKIMIGDVCPYAFAPDKCFCGQKTLRTDASSVPTSDPISKAVARLGAQSPRVPMYWDKTYTSFPHSVRMEKRVVMALFEGCSSKFISDVYSELPTNLQTDNELITLAVNKVNKKNATYLLRVLDLSHADSTTAALVVHKTHGGLFECVTEKIPPTLRSDPTVAAAIDLKRPAF